MTTETPCGLWRRLDSRSREKMLETYVLSVQEDGLPPPLVREVSTRLRFRENTVRRARTKQLARLLARAILNGSNHVAINIERHFVAVERNEVLRRVLDSLGVEQDDTVVDDDSADTPLDGAVIEPTVALAAGDTNRQVSLCLEVLLYSSPPSWYPVLGKIVEKLREEGLSIDHAAALSTARRETDDRVSSRNSVEGRGAAISSHPSSPMESSEGEPSLDRPGFTTLDKVLIRAVISSLNDMHGALDEDDLDDLVQETLELNDARAQSYFHRGFLDALMERSCQSMGPGENSERRAWYLAGFCHGLIRHKGTIAGASFICELSAVDSNAFLGSRVAAGSFLLPVLIGPLLDQKHFDVAERWLKVYLDATLVEVVPQLIEWARMAFLATDPGIVARFLELCRERIPAISKRHGDPPLDLIQRLDRRLAIALRLQGKTNQAEPIVDRLLKEVNDDAAKSKLIGDKLLIRMGMRSLEDLRVGKEETREALGAALDSVGAILDEAIAGGKETSVVTDVAVAVRTLLHGAESTSELEPAVASLRRAARVLEDWNKEFWTKNGVLPRVRFYLSLLELRLLDPTIAAPATTRLISLLEEGLSEPVDLIVDTVVHAVVQEVPDADRLARMVLGRQPQAALSRLDLSSLVSRSLPFRRKVVEALEDNQDLLTTRERWTAWRGVLKGALSADERDLETARRALDELEVLARVRDFAEEFTTLLQNSANWEPAWDDMDAELARFRVLEATGNIEEARVALVAVSHKAISEEAADAEELVNQLERLGECEETLTSLRLRLRARPDIAEVEEDEPVEEPVSILFFGGNEKQAAYEQRILDMVAAGFPGCTVSFHFDCWSSNWGRQVEHYVQAMGDADAVVLMRFMRTELGRQLRRLTGEAGLPWVPCGGHGQESMLRAIRTAIKVGREQKRLRERNE